jgi:hypothetical protein
VQRDRVNIGSYEKNMEEKLGTEVTHKLENIIKDYDNSWE